MARALTYRPDPYDDWGMIRNADGSIFAVVRCPASSEDLARHREAGTDPYEPVARRLIASCQAESAVAYLLDRSLRDDELYYHIGYGTEAFRRLTHAYAALTGEEPATVEKRYAR